MQAAQSVSPADCIWSCDAAQCPCTSGGWHRNARRFLHGNTVMWRAMNVDGPAVGTTLMPKGPKIPSRRCPHAAWCNVQRPLGTPRQGCDYLCRYRIKLYIILSSDTVRLLPIVHKRISRAAAHDDTSWPVESARSKADGSPYASMSAAQAGALQRRTRSSHGPHPHARTPGDHPEIIVPTPVSVSSSMRIECRDLPSMMCAAVTP